VRKYRNVRIVKDAKKAKKLVAKPQYQQRVIYAENLVAIQLNKTIVKLIIIKHNNNKLVHGFILINF
jgi:hypothetical protein